MSAGVSPDRVRELFAYKDGSLFWKSKANSRSPVRVGAKAGSKHPTGRVKVKIDGRLHWEHRLIWLMHHGDPLPETIDHINRDPSDNRIENLRSVTRAENAWNQDRRGVSWNRGKWQARIRKHGVVYHLGRFETEKEALAAYRAAKDQMHIIGEPKEVS